MKVQLVITLCLCVFTLEVVKAGRSDKMYKRGAGSCEGRCTQSLGDIASCYCDVSCMIKLDCCADYTTHCQSNIVKACDPDQYNDQIYQRLYKDYCEENYPLN